MRRQLFMPATAFLLRLGLSLVLCLSLATGAQAAAGTPEALAARIGKALQAGDADALLAEVHLEQPPAMLLFMILDLPGECTGGVTCTTNVAPVDETWRQRNAQQMETQGAEMPVPPEGLIAIEGKGGEGDTSHSMRVQLPYAKVGGEYRVIMGRWTAKKRAELLATTPQAAAEATLAQGVYDPATGERDLEWKQKATALPADGGAPGAAFLAQVKAMAAAVKARDVDAAAQAGGAWGEAVLGATDYAGKPRPLVERQRKLRSQAVRFLTEARVLGGWQRGDTALLVVEGKNGAGNTLRGAQLMQLEDGAWTDGGSDFVEVPPAR